MGPRMCLPCLSAGASSVNKDDNPIKHWLDGSLVSRDGRDFIAWDTNPRIGGNEAFRDVWETFVTGGFLWL